MKKWKAQQNKNIAKLFRTVLFATLLVELTSSIAALIDVLIISWCVGETAVAAVGLVSPVLLLQQAMATALCAATVVVCSQCLGKGHNHKVDGVFTGSFFVLMGASVVLALLLFLGAEPFARLLGARNNDYLLTSTSRYLQGFALGIPGSSAVLFLTPLEYVNGNKKYMWKVALCAALVNVACSLIGVLYFHWGVVGVAIGTSISSYVAMGILLQKFIRKDAPIHLSGSKVTKEALRSMVGPGAWNGLQGLFASIGTLLMNQLITSKGTTEALEAYSIYKTVDPFILVFISAMASATITITGMLFAEEDLPALRQLNRSAMFYGVGFAALVGVLEFITAPYLFALFLSGEALDIMVTLARITSLTLPFLAIRQYYISYLQGVNEDLGATLLYFFGDLVFNVGFALLFYRWLGITGFWLGLMTADIGCMVVLLMMVKHHDIKLKKQDTGVWILPKGRDLFYFLPYGFGSYPGDRVQFTIKGPEDVVNLSLRVEAFCKEHNVDRKRTYYLSLAAEEMVGNVVDHGFTRDDKEHQIDVCVIARWSGKLKLRIRDDCVTFNPLDWYEANSEDPTKDIGIRLIMATAKKVEYSSAYGLNNLIITV